MKTGAGDLPVVHRLRRAPSERYDCGSIECLCYAMDEGKDGDEWWKVVWVELMLGVGDETGRQGRLSVVAWKYLALLESPVFALMKALVRRDGMMVEKVVVLLGELRGEVALVSAIK